MRSQFLLVPAALIAAAPVQAWQYISVDEAQRAMFPGATFKLHTITMDTNQFYSLMKASNVTVWSSTIRAWKASTGGWFFLDQVLGRDDHITYAVALNDAGIVTSVEIIDCIATYDQIRRPYWLAQFKGKTTSSGNLVEQVEIISGVSLSSEHVAEGVRRILAAHALFFAQKKG